MAAKHFILSALVQGVWKCGSCLLDFSRGSATLTFDLLLVRVLSSSAGSTFEAHVHKVHTYTRIVSLKSVHDAGNGEGLDAFSPRSYFTKTNDE